MHPRLLHHNSLLFPYWYIKVFAWIVVVMSYLSFNESFQPFLKVIQAHSSHEASNPFFEKSKALFLFDPAYERQNNCQEFTISFKENFNYELDDGMVWKVFSQNKNLFYKGSGSIYGLQFQKPGLYQVDLKQPQKYGKGLFGNSNDLFSHQQCNHSPFPDLLEIKVTPCI
jgi:hypothetical protein